MNWQIFKTSIHLRNSRSEGWGNRNTGFTSPTWKLDFQVGRGKKNTGFTLFEVVVTVGIFVALTSVVLLRYSQFQGTVLTTNLAYDVALSIRQAQVYGVGVREALNESGLALGFLSAYGVHFDFTNSVADGDDHTYILFFDATNSGPQNQFIYNDGLDADVERFTIKGGHAITKVCSDESNGFTSQRVCSDDPAIQGNYNLDVSFLRPNPNALYRRYTNAGVQASGTIVKAYIEVAASNGTKRTVVIHPSGQISVEKKAITDIL